MTRMRRIAQVGTAVAVALMAGTTFGQGPGKLSVEEQAVDAGPATADERAALLEQFVSRWSDYARANYGADVAVWRRQVGQLFENGDPTNLRQAVQRETFEGAIAMLRGTGHRVTDAQVVSQASSAGSGRRATSLTEQLLGSTASDLVYTPIQPCRILDTRSTGAGAIAAGATRNFVAANATDFSAQGGSPTGCGTLGQTATAVAINLTAVTPSGPGYATVFPFGTALPLAASINYSAGSIVNNALITRIPFPVSSFDFTIFTLATSHYVADIVGYFAPPVATPLQCWTVNSTPTDVSAGAFTALPLVTCPATYTPVSMAISSSESVLVSDSYMAANVGQIYVKSLSVNTQSVTAKLTCCRIPGR